MLQRPALPCRLASDGGRQAAGTCACRRNCRAGVGRAPRILAPLYALGQAAGQGLVPSEVARLAVHVEPTDSSLFPGLALWDHRYGHVYEDLGAPPALTVVILDPGGVVDTLAFNQFDYREVLGRLAPSIVKPLPSCVRACGRATWKLSVLRRHWC